MTAAPGRAATVQVLTREAGEAAGSGASAEGLLVPAAGPRTSREQALASLVSGRVRNTALEQREQDPPLIELGPRPRADVTIVVELPPAGGRPNDTRYRLTIDSPGYEGILTSDSTRIPGLVSIADVAPTVLALERGEKPPIRATSGSADDLEELDDWIEAKNSVRLPLMILAAALVAVLALVRPRAALTALASLLLANLAAGIWVSADGWSVVLALAVLGAAALVWLPAVDPGLALAGTVVAYLAALGADGASVALSPLGPTQNSRFYGLSNVLATFLTAAALAAAWLLARRYGPAAFAAVAAAAFVAISGNRFGADGGGAVVAAAGFGVLAALVYRRRWKLVGALVLAAAVGLFALDLATGGESHVTRALDDGVWDDLSRRLELSWERATKSWLDALYLGALLAALLALLARAWRHALALALGAALVVSLVVNDSPNEVLIPGVACLLAFSMLRDREDAAGA